MKPVMKTDPKALKAAALMAAIVFIVFEALSILVTWIDPSGGLLRIDLRNPVLHLIIVIAALLFGLTAYLREARKTRQIMNK